MSAENIPLNVAIFIFDDVDVLDFAGPFEVFTIANVRFSPGSLNVFTVGRTLEPITARTGLSVTPRYHFADCPSADVLIVPGGPGVDGQLEVGAARDFVVKQAKNAKRVLSVCNGTVMLARCGLLDGLRATTHFADLPQLKEYAPNTTLVEGTRYVDNGQIVTSAGISSGIDMCLHIVEEFFGPTVATQTARWMEYQPSNLPSQRQSGN